MSSDPTERTLRLLGLLQSRPSWPPPELASRLSASPRTLRRDLTRLRGLGYDVTGRPGPGGHYALRRGGRVPPLLFDDEELVALVVALRMAEDRLAGDAAGRVLAKLSSLLPERLAGTVETAAAGSAALRRDPPDLDPAVLAALTRAGAEDREAHFDYIDQHDTASHRRVDGVRCLHSRGQWYVVAHDLDRMDWRVFRMDRVADVDVSAARSRPRPGPADDLVAWLETDFGRQPRVASDR